MQRVDHHVEIVEPDDAFELEARAFFAHPDDIGLDPSDHGQADDDAIAPSEIRRVVDHEAVCRNVRDVKLHIAAIMVFGDNRIIDRMACCATLVGYR